MKIIINKNGKLEDVPDKVASRLINKGKAHPAPIILNPIQVKKLKEIIPKEQKVKPKIIVDIPDEVYEIPEPKKYKPKKNKRSRKKKAIKFKPISVSTDFEDHLRELM